MESQASLKQLHGHKLIMHGKILGYGKKVLTIELDLGENIN